MIFFSLLQAQSFFTPRLQGIVHLDIRVWNCIIGARPKASPVIQTGGSKRTGFLRRDAAAS